MLAFDKDYRRIAFQELVESTSNHLLGDCPLLEDEVIIWASEEIETLTRLVNVLNKS